MENEHKETSVPEKKDECKCCCEFKGFDLEKLPMKNIFLWKDRMMAGIVFLTGLLFFYLITRGRMTLMTLGSYIGLTVLILTTVYSQVSGMIGNKKPYEAVVKKDFPRDDTIDRHVEHVLKIVSHLVFTVKSLVYVENLGKTIKAIFYLWIVSIFGRMFHLVTLLFLGFLFLMTCPLIYSFKRAEIDALVKKLIAKYSEIVDKIIAKFPKLEPLLKCHCAKKEE